jgi:hypothetical protein
MALLNILRYPDPRLYYTGDPVNPRVIVRLKSRPAQFLLESSLPECIRLRIACFAGIFWI